MSSRPADRNGICRQSNHISQQSAVGNASPEGGLPSKVYTYTVIFVTFRVFLFGGRHVSELPTCEITNFAKRQFAARIVFVTNRLPVRVLDEPITPICVIFRCESFWSRFLFRFGLCQDYGGGDQKPEEVIHMI